MGLELIDPSGSVVAEVFKCDSSKKVIVTTFNNDIPLEIFDYYYQEALIRLDPFEDGSPSSPRELIMNESLDVAAMPATPRDSSD